MMFWFSFLVLVFLISVVWYAPSMADWLASKWNSIGYLGTWPFVSASQPGSSNNPSPLDPNAARITATAVLVGAWAGFALRISGQMNERLGTVDLFLYQIVATCRVMAAVNMVDGFIVLWRETKVKGFADSARQEDYFSHFDSMGRSIGDLNRLDVARTTEFFTYLKASRDATRAFENWKTKDGTENTAYLEEDRQRDVLHVIYLLFLVLESASYCVEGFARKKQKPFLQRLVASQIVNAHNFLITTLASDDGRRSLLTMPRRTVLIAAQRALISG